MPTPITDPLSKARRFASMHVYREMYRDDGFGHANKFEKLAEQSRAEGWPTPAERFQTVFESRYLPHIRFVEMDDLFRLDPLALSVGSPKDVATAQLAALLACSRAVVVSRDSHLRRPGLAPRSLEPVFEASATIETADTAIYGSVYVSAAAVLQIDKGVKALAGKLDVKPAYVWIGGLILMGALCLIVLRSPERRKQARALVAPIGGFYVEIVNKGNLAAMQLAASSVAPPQNPVLEQRLARHFAQAQGPLPVEELAAALAYDGLGQEPEEDELQATLTARSCFVQSAGGWQLGGPMSPPVGL
jgi:hypothetical protein